MRKVLFLLKPYRLAMLVAWGLMLIELLVELWHPMFMAKIIDEGIMKGDMREVMKWGGIMIGLSMFSFAAGITNSFFSSYVSQHFGFDARAAVFKRIQSFSFHQLAQFQTSTLITRLTNDVTQIQNTVFMSLRIAMRAPLLIIGGAAMALLVNVKLALFLIFPIPLLVILLIWMMNRSGKMFRFVQERLDKVNNIMQESLSSIRLIKAFIRKKYEKGRFYKANANLKDQTMKALRLVELVAPILLFVMNIGILAILWFGTIEVNQANMKVGEIVAIINYGFRITSALSILTWIIMALSRGRASAQRISEVLETKEEHSVSNIGHTEVTIRNGRVEFDQVSFTYPATTEHVLSNVSFTVEPGETVAIMGATGSGKTTLFQLIPRLYEATSGRILIDGIDITHLSFEMLRNEIGFVPQESILFTGSVKNNIAWGKEDATMEEMIQCAIDAQIHDTIVKLPQQYETQIGQKGVNLSGGQKQRLAIARALIRKPTLLFLGDSTSALDLKTEANLLAALEKYQCTTFIITQKIATAMKADQILLLEDGRLIANGNHYQLLATSALYQDIYKSQFAKEDAADG